MYKIITVMPDFSSSCLWDEHGVMIEDESLKGLPGSFWDDRDSWLEFYDRDCHTRHFSFKKDKALARRLNDWGRHIARKIKERYPDRTVYYRGEEYGKVYDPEPIVEDKGQI